MPSRMGHRSGYSSRSGSSGRSGGNSSRGRGAADAAVSSSGGGGRAGRGGGHGGCGGGNDGDEGDDGDDGSSGEGGGGGGGGSSDDVSGEGDNSELGRSRLDTAYKLWIRRNVTFIPGTGIAIIDPAAVYGDLAFSTDITNRKAMKLQSFYRGIHDCLIRLRYKPHQIVWPEDFDLPTRRNIPIVRSIIDQGTGGEIYLGKRECRHCAAGGTCADLRVVCASQPVQRDGCYFCKARNIANCSQKMELNNPVFTAWNLADVRAERRVFDALEREVESLSELAEDVSQVLREALDADVIDAAANAVIKAVLGRDGSQVRLEAVLELRAELGSENGTRIADGDVRLPQRR